MGGKVFLHLASAIEFVCGSQVASFHLVEDGLGVDKSALREVEVDACAQKLLGKHRDVEMVGVVSGKVAILHLLAKLLGHILERRRVLHVVVRDACQLGHFLRNGFARVD